MPSALKPPQAIAGRSWDDWAEFLADFFFDDAHAGEEILFAVDDRSLAEASGLDESIVAASLGNAVRSVVGSGWMLGAILRRVLRWRAEGTIGAHPGLPILALSVLAAARMGEHSTFAAHNYYVPLRRLLDPSDDETGPPGSFTDYIERLWDDLARWANQDFDGHRGRIVIRDPGHFRYVGLAIQHALVKSSDLRRLDTYFRRIGLAPGEDITPAELRRALAVWTAGRPEPWAQRLRRISTDPDLVEHCEALLYREARRWDGRPRDPRTGRPVGRIRLGFRSVRRPILGLLVQWEDRLPESVTVLQPSGTELTLTKDHTWYQPHPLEGLDVARTMLGGVELRGDGYRFDLQGDDVYAMSYDDDLGAWVSRDSMSYGDRYHLLVWREAMTEVLAFASSASALDARVDETASRSLPAGWKLIVDVRIDARPKTNPPRGLSSLVPAGSGPRLRLLGGLPLTAAQAAYLRGGEPALALSSVATADHVSIRRESTGQVEQLRVVPTANQEVPLWQLQLEPDTYEIRHGDSKVTLQIVDGIAEAAGLGVGTIRHRGVDSIEVFGTATSAPRSHRAPITVPAPAPGTALILLGARPGEHHVVELPSWLSAHAGFDLSWRHVDAWPEFEPVWLLLRGSSGFYEASLVVEVEPEAGQGAAATQWGRLIAVASLCPWEGDAAVALWERYRRAAGVRP